MATQTASESWATASAGNPDGGTSWAAVPKCNALMTDAHERVNDALAAPNDATFLSAGQGGWKVTLKGWTSPPELPAAGETIHTLHYAFRLKSADIGQRGSIRAEAWKTAPSRAMIGATEFGYDTVGSWVNVKISIQNVSMTADEWLTHELVLSSKVADGTEVTPASY